MLIKNIILTISLSHSIYTYSTLNLKKVIKIKTKYKKNFYGYDRLMIIDSDNNHYEFSNNIWLISLKKKYNYNLVSVGDYIFIDYYGIDFFGKKITNINYTDIDEYNCIFKKLNY